jgi:hypothetical protein
MPHVAALYRYPVKGFTPEECDTLTVLAEGESSAIEFSVFVSLTRRRPMMRGAGSMGWLR